MNQVMNILKIRVDLRLRTIRITAEYNKNNNKSKGYHPFIQPRKVIILHKNPPNQMQESEVELNHGHLLIVRTK